MKPTGGYESVTPFAASAGDAKCYGRYVFEFGTPTDLVVSVFVQHFVV